MKEVDEKLARVRALVPDVYGEEELSPWAYPCAALAGKDHGLVLIPEKEDGIYIEFLAGSPARPVWSGGWCADGELPEPGSQKGRAPVTTNGLQILLDYEKHEVRRIVKECASSVCSKDEITLKAGSAEISVSKSGVNINKGAIKVS